MKTLSEYNNIQQNDDILNEGLLSNFLKNFLDLFKDKTEAKLHTTSTGTVTSLFGKQTGSLVSSAYQTLYSDMGDELEGLYGDDFINEYMSIMMAMLDPSQPHESYLSNFSNMIYEEESNKDKKGLLKRFKEKIVNWRKKNEKNQEKVNKEAKLAEAKAWRWRGYEEKYVKDYHDTVRIIMLDAFSCLINKYKKNGKEDTAALWNKKLDTIRSYSCMKTAVDKWDGVYDKTEENNKEEEQKLPRNKQAIKDILDKVCSDDYKGGDENAIRKIIEKIYDLYKNSKSSDKNDWAPEELKNMLKHILNISSDDTKFNVKDKNSENKPVKDSLYNSYLENIITEAEKETLKKVKNNINNALLVALKLKEFETADDDSRYESKPEENGIADILNNKDDWDDDNIRKDIMKLAGIKSEEESEEKKNEDNGYKSKIAEKLEGKDDFDIGGLLVMIFKEFNKTNPDDVKKDIENICKIDSDKENNIRTSIIKYYKDNEEIKTSEWNKLIIQKIQSVSSKDEENNKYKDKLINFLKDELKCDLIINQTIFDIIKQTKDSKNFEDCDGKTKAERVIKNLVKAAIKDKDNADFIKGKLQSLIKDEKEWNKLFNDIVEYKDINESLKGFKTLSLLIKEEENKENKIATIIKSLFNDDEVGDWLKKNIKLDDSSNNKSGETDDEDDKFMGAGPE